MKRQTPLSLPSMIPLSPQLMLPIPPLPHTLLPTPIPLILPLSISLIINWLLCIRFRHLLLLPLPPPPPLSLPLSLPPLLPLPLSLLLPPPTTISPLSLTSVVASVKISTGSSSDEPPAISRDELTPTLVYSPPNSGCARASIKDYS